MNSSALYFCESCRKSVARLEDLYFVESKGARGFCSERCIERFYLPLVDYFENAHHNFRQTLNLEQELCQNLATNSEIMSECLGKPEEVWQLSNELDDNYYTFIKPYDDSGTKVFLIAICLVYNGHPSFVLSATATSNHSLLDKLQRGEKIQDLDRFLQMDNGKETLSSEIDEQVISRVEAKKSTLLAWLLEQRRVDDIAIENFASYHEYERLTLDDPDEIYEWQDAEDDIMLTYIKAHAKEEKSFYYLVVCSLFSENGVNQVAIPVLSFPSNDPNLYNFFKKGEKVSGSLRN